MSVSTTAAGWDSGSLYRNCSAIELVEWLETQQARGEYKPDLVWELASRALELEELKTRIAAAT